MGKGMGDAIFGHFKILQDEIRVRLLYILEQSRCNVGELSQILQIPQPSISRHLKKLLDDGWLIRESENTTGWYSFQPAFLEDSTQKALWEVVSTDIQTKNRKDGICFEEDLERLQSVLVLRRTNSQNFFATIGRQWEDVRRGLFGDAYLLPTLLSLLPSHLRIIDIGCGTGDALEALAPFSKTLIGVDQSVEMIQLAEERLQKYKKHEDHISLICGNIVDIDINEPVDVALSMLVLHHLNDIEAVFQKMQSILSQEGRFIVLDMQAHQQLELQRNMGHVHLGFERSFLEDIAQKYHFCLQSWRNINKAEEAVGPELFLAVFTKK